MADDNKAQAQSDATNDEIGRRLEPDYTKQSDRAHGRGSDANDTEEARIETPIGYLVISGVRDIRG